MLRRSLKRATSAAILVLLGAAAPAAQVDEPLYPDLPNFHKVDEHLLRGGQPGAGGVARLKALGVRTIVNLRHEPARVKAEMDEAAAAGLRYFSVPMYGLVRPTSEQVARVLGLIGDKDNWPVFIHCKAGADRTGVIVACYRVAQAGWTAEKAIREALDYGMMRIEFAKRSFVRDFYASLQSAGGRMAHDGLAHPVPAMPHAGPER
ncbi:MAG TPA: tyrosine-protein phosphatase [Candidatus Polarisedimenticolia bacterium]|jgi:protein tyrosine/serine phosphatase|nr:tyrosine-protein phosphatase [Candidatus Polarisedimenticolia bacterium]